MDNKEKEKTDGVLISEDEVWDILEFSRSYTGLSGMPLGIDLLNQRLKDITLLNTGEVTETEVSNALKAPKDNEQELQRIGQSFEITSSLYKRLLSYMGNIPSFDYTYTCTNAESKDYTKPGYKKDLRVLKEFMDSFDYKQEFGKIVKQLFREEVYFGVFRDEGKRFVLQELPSDRAKITGRWDYGILFSFDYYYFMSGGVNIDMYPSVFKNVLNKLLTGREDSSGKSPSNNIRLRGHEGFGGQWMDCSPADGFWAFKFSPEIITRIPYFVGMFPDIVQEGTIRALQKSSYMAAASKIIMGEVPMLPDAKASVKNKFAISPELLGKFLALVKSAIDSTAVKVAASPLQNVESFDFQSDPEIRSSYLRTTLGSAGGSTNLLFSNDQKLNTLETGLALAVDEILVTSVYPQFADFLNWNINQRTGKFKFNIKFEGTKFYTDRERRMDSALGLANLGMVLPQKIAAASGMSPFEFERQLAEAKAMGFVDNLTPIVLASQLSKEDEVAGRPKKSDDKIGESGEQTRSDGGNTEAK